MIKRVKPIRVNGRGAWVKSVDVIAATVRGEDKICGHIGGVVQDKDHPFVLTVDREQTVGGLGNVLIDTGYNHVKMDFWTKGDDMVFKDIEW